MRQAQAVADYLGSRGFRNVTISPSRMLVSADGTAMTARDAFATTFAQVRTRDGRFAYANTDVVRVPASLGGIVDSVLGLQNVHVPHAAALRASLDDVHTMWFVGHSPTDFRKVYMGAGSAFPASKIPVGIVTEGDLTQTKADLNTFTTAKGLATVATQTVNTGGTSGDTTHTEAWDLASQDIVGMAGSVKKLVFYNIPGLSNANLTQDFDAIRAADAVKIIEVSFAECEDDANAAAGGDGSAATDDAILLLAAAQGQTFAVSTGDSGADECGNGTNTPSYPASSPWVVAVAGTHLGGPAPQWHGEFAWNFSGGSPSTFEPMPAWQTAFGVPGTLRGTPDLAYDADPKSGALIYVNGALGQYGGTGLSASLFAGMWATYLEQRPGEGFAGPLIYRMALRAFHDIVSGNNGGGEHPRGIGYDAVRGYDFASGRGSLKIKFALLQTIPVEQLLYDTGFESTTSSAWNANPAAIIVNNAAKAHKGSFYASLGGTTSSTQTLGQPVAITAGRTLASLRFYLKTTTAETGATAKDTLSVDAYGGGHLLGHLGTFSNLDASTGYVVKSFDVSRFIGQAIAIRFTATNDGTNATTWSVDDVTLNVE